MGVRYLSEGNYQEAIIAFTAAIEIDPKQKDAYIGMADAYTAMDETEKAVEILSKALEELGDDPDLTARLESLGFIPGLKGPMRTDHPEYGFYFLNWCDENWYMARQERRDIATDELLDYSVFEVDEQGQVEREIRCFPNHEYYLNQS